MTELLTSRQMRELEQAAIASGDVTGLELMERAGHGVVDAVFEEWPELAIGPHRAVVLCGPGNNGGDGFVVARLLKGQGWEVEVFLYGDPEKLPPDARVNCERWLALGAMQDLTEDEIEGYAEDNPGTVLAVDALFGSGLSRPFQSLGRVQDELNYWQATANRPRVVSVDIPSGICADSGRYLGYDGENPYDSAVMANLTVTFHTPFIGHFIAEGSLGIGKLATCDIGLAGPDGPAAKLVEVDRSVYLIWKRTVGNKFSHGHALTLAGPMGKTGAARLAARGALRVGAGLVTVGASPDAMPECAAQLTAIMLNEVADGVALSTILTDARINALCLGPGLGTDQYAGDLIAAALEAKRPTVLDADALSQVFFDEAHALFGTLHEGCVLTPHGGEFARLFPDIAAKLSAASGSGPAYSKVDATRDAAARAGCVVLFKGPDTVIADPGGKASINSAQYDRAAPWLATAGAGDVLAGFITGLLARGFAPMDAAETAAWLHVECALAFGPGLIAEDLPEMIPQVFRSLEA